MLLHRKGVSGVPTSKSLHRYREESAVEVESFVGHVHEHTETDLGDGVEDTGVDAVTATINIGGTLRDLETGNVSFSSPTLGKGYGVEFFGIVTEVIDVAVARWNVVVELIASHTHKRGVEERLDVEGRWVLRVVIGVLRLEVTAGVDGLKQGFSISVLAIGRTAEFPAIAVDDDTGVAGDRVVSVEDERFEDLHVLNDESAVLKNSLSVPVGRGQ